MALKIDTNPAIEGRAEGIEVVGSTVGTETVGNEVNSSTQNLQNRNFTRKWFHLHGGQNGPKLGRSKHRDCTYATANSPWSRGPAMDKTTLPHVPPWTKSVQPWAWIISVQSFANKFKHSMLKKLKMCFIVRIKITSKIPNYSL